MTAIERAIRRGGVRAARLDRIPGGHLALVRTIERTLPRLFDPVAAGDLDATFALEINHPRGRRPDVLALTVRNAALTVTRGRPQHAGATVSIGADDMVRLATGDTGWPELLAAGRLELSGDPFLALRFPRLFALPAAAGEPILLRAWRAQLSA
jgi:alkyl sulfatase BDS1-like metallo-beta-lactamase superfamily hydrolase